MIAADDRLSRCAGALLSLVHTRDVACAQYAVLGFREAHLALFRDNYARAALGVVADHGYTARSFAAALAERTCARFVEIDLGSTLLGAPPVASRGTEARG